MLAPQAVSHFAHPVNTVIQTFFNGLLLAFRPEYRVTLQAGSIVNSFEDNSHAFIVRFWLEPREIEGTEPQWRGVIEHVESGRVIALKDLNEIKAFIGTYLPGMCTGQSSI